jgi:hypothetical protein
MRFDHHQRSDRSTGRSIQELIKMTDALEEWNARRMGLLFELAKLRKTSIDEVMREFRHRDGAHA